MENVGALIRKRREELGLKVYELAKKIGVSAVYITQIEKHNKLPPYELFMKIEKVLGTDAGIYHPYLRAKYPEILRDLEKRNKE